MSYSQRTRDRYRLAVSAVTGLTAAGALTAGGWLAGVAAQTTGAGSDTAPPPAPPPTDTVPAATPSRTPPKVVVKERPQVTRVTTRYVTSPGGPAVGGGGTVTAQTSAGSSHAQPAAHAPAPAPQPAPQPAPAPSSGS